ncbi:hypothetical protein AAC387_Pa03g0846 [Persea americana]
MASPQHVEMEAAKLLQKLIQESKDEPAKLATKLFMICQHMKSSGKEQSLPYQVISRAMETVITNHGLDINSLKFSRLPLAGGAQVGDSGQKNKDAPGNSSGAIDMPVDGGPAGTWNAASSSKNKEDNYRSSGHGLGVSKESEKALVENDVPKQEAVSSIGQAAGPCMSATMGDIVNPRSIPEASTNIFEHDSEEPRSANLQEINDAIKLDKHMRQKDNKKVGAKRKKADSSPEVRADALQQLDSLGVGFNSKEKAIMRGDIQSHSPAKKVAADVVQQKLGILKDAVPRISEKVLEAQWSTSFRGRDASAYLATGKTIEHGPGISRVGTNTFSMTQGGGTLGSASKENILGKSEISDNSGQDSFAKSKSEALQRDVRVDTSTHIELNPRRSISPNDMGKTLTSQASAPSDRPFKEHQLKQLRAQCLVHLAFRNRLVPRKLHLDIALGESYPNEGGADGIHGLNDHSRAIPLKEPFNNQEITGMSARSSDTLKNEKEMSLTRISPGSSSTASLVETDVSSKDTEITKKMNKKGPQSNRSVVLEEKKRLSALKRKPDVEKQTRESGESQTLMMDSDSPMNSGRTSSECQNDKKDTFHDTFRETSGPIDRERVPGRVDGSYKQSQAAKENDGISGFCKAESPTVQATASADTYSSLLVKEKIMPITPVAGKDVKFANFNDVGPAEIYPAGRSTEQEEENKSDSDDMPVSAPKYSTSEKWIMDHCERKVLEEQNWALKQRRTEERIAVCFDRLKENVSSAGDISAKTKSVIELKKLQLLKLQRRLRSDFLNDFFKPITSNMERLKSIKKHRHGRRIKQLEKFEQKMKEERQKRISERQKEFFSEIEAHKERLEDVFKIKRERCKGFHKYVKEFHKRKERIHREKIDRIQREKILLLKSNDVEGYLRMVQDTKSDRVKQLLKETEKYLQKLSSKLKEAKDTARSFEMEMDDGRGINVEKNEISVGTEDESDQAQHYLESNEKYYLLAHSVKESINEQPASLQGGKLREYQMNGLRWLVSLYNNHLNGILADEMGLGKTVQVISLICYLMEMKNSRGPFLVVVPSSVLPGWESEISFWAPSINSITYAGPPEARRRLFRERIAPQKFNVLLTTYEYLMNKNDRPKLSKIHWHYIVIDEGHRIKNASCKLNADLKHFQSSHRLLLTGTPLQNNLEELWALLNFLLPNIFNSSEDFSQWFNKPFESSGDNSPDEALLSEEENLLIINRLHQVLRPFVLRRLKHKVANELPEKIERLVRCEASAYQKLLMKRVEDNLGSLGFSKGRTVHNSVMELRNICNHPYISQLHADEVNNLIPKHYLPPIVRLCGKLEMLDRLLPKLKATDHRVLLFSTMTRLLDIMEEYLNWKGYKYLRLDGHTSGNERGALIEEFNRPESQAFIFLLSLRAGGVGVNLQAADTVIIFDTDWNPQVDLQAQARAHRLGQKKDVLVLRLETVHTVEEQVRAAAEHKLGVANQSITAGFFDNNTSAEDRREYLESLLRECKKEETASVLGDDALNDLIARSGSEIDIFESIDKHRHEKEMALWQNIQGQSQDASEPVPPMPPRLVTDEDLKAFYQAMQIYEESNAGVKRKTEYLGDLDTQQYGRGKRAREVRSYEDQWTEEEFEKLCQADSPESSEIKETPKDSCTKKEAGGPGIGATNVPPLPSKELPLVPCKEPLPSSSETVPPSKGLTPSQSKEPMPQSKEIPSPSKELPPPLPSKELPPPSPSKELPPPTSKESLQLSKQVPPQLKESQQPSKESTLPTKETHPPSSEPPVPAKRGRGRPKRTAADVAPSPRIPSVPSGTVCKQEMEHQRETLQCSTTTLGPDSSIHIKGSTVNPQHPLGVGTIPGPLTTSSSPLPTQVTGQNQKIESGSSKRRKRAKKQNSDSPAIGPEVSSIPMVPMQVDMAADRNATFSFAQQMGRLIRPSGTSNATPVNFELNQISRIPNVVFLVPVLTPTTSIAPVSEAQAATFETQRKQDSANVCANRAGQQLNISQSSTVAYSLAPDLLERRTLRAGNSDMTSDEKQKHTEKPQLSSVQTSQKAGLGIDASKTDPPSSVCESVKAAKFNAPDKSSQEVKCETAPVPVTLLRKKSPPEESKTPASVKRGSRRKGSASTADTRRKNTRSVSAAALDSGHVVMESKNLSYSKSSGDINITTDKEGNGGKQTGTVTSVQACNSGDRGHNIYHSDSTSSGKPNSSMSTPCLDSFPSGANIVGVLSNECSMGSKDGSSHITHKNSKITAESAGVHSPKQHLKSVTPVSLKATSLTINPASQKQERESAGESTTGRSHEINESCASESSNPSFKAFGNKSSLVASEGTIGAAEKVVSSDGVMTESNNSHPVVSNALSDRTDAIPDTTRTDAVSNIEGMVGGQFTEVQNVKAADSNSPNTSMVSETSKKDDDVAGLSQCHGLSSLTTVMLVPVLSQSTEPVQHIANPAHTSGTVIASGAPLNPDKDSCVDGNSKKQNVPCISPGTVCLIEGPDFPHSGLNVPVSYQETKLDQHAFEGTIPVDIGKEASDPVVPTDSNILRISSTIITSGQSIQDDILSETTCIGSENMNSPVPEAIQSVAAESSNADPLLEDCCEPQVAAVDNKICINEASISKEQVSVEMVEDDCSDGVPNMHKADKVDPTCINQDHVEEIKAPTGNSDPSSSPSLREDNEKMDGFSKGSIVGTESNDVINISQVCPGDKDAPAGSSDLSSSPSSREVNEKTDGVPKDSTVGTESNDVINISQVCPGDEDALAGNTDLSSSPSLREDCEKIDGVSKGSVVGTVSNDVINISQFSAGDKDVPAGNSDPSSSSASREDSEKIDGVSNDYIIGIESNDGINTSLVCAGDMDASAANLDPSSSPSSRREDNEKVNDSVSKGSTVATESNDVMNISQDCAGDMDLLAGKSDTTSSLSSREDNGKIDGISTGSTVDTVSNDVINISQDCAGDKVSSAGNSDPSSSPSSREHYENLDGASKDSIVGSVSNDVINISQVCAGDMDASAGNLDPFSSHSSREDNEKIDDGVLKGSIVGTESDDMMNISQVRAGDMDASAGSSGPSSSPPSKEDNKKMDGVSEGSVVGAESNDVMINISQVCAGDMDASAGNSDPSSSPPSRDDNEKKDGVSKGSVVGAESNDVVMNISPVCVGDMDASAGNSDPSSPPPSREDNVKMDGLSKGSTLGVESDDVMMNISPICIGDMDVSAGNSDPSSSPPLREDNEKMDDLSKRSTLGGESNDAMMNISPVCTGDMDALAGNSDPSSSPPSVEENEKMDAVSKGSIVGAESNDVMINISQVCAGDTVALAGNSDPSSSPPLREDNEKMDGVSKVSTVDAESNDVMLNISQVCAGDTVASAGNSDPSSSPPLREDNEKMDGVSKVFTVGAESNDVMINISQVCAGDEDGSMPSCSSLGEDKRMDEMSKKDSVEGTPKSNDMDNPGDSAQEKRELQLVNVDSSSPSKVEEGEKAINEQ